MDLGRAIKKHRGPTQSRKGPVTQGQQSLGHTASQQDLLGFRSTPRKQTGLRTGQIFKASTPSSSQQVEVVPQSKQLLKAYSSFGTLPAEQPRSKITAREYLAQKNALLHNRERIVKPHKEEPRPEKRQFKLIHQMKQERSRAQQQIRSANQQHTQPPTIQAASQSQMHFFAQEINLVLDPSAPSQTQEHQQPFQDICLETFEQPRISKVKQDGLKPSLSGLGRQSQVRQLGAQSVVVVDLPSQIQGSSIEILVKKQSKEEPQRTPDLNRSVYLAEKLLLLRKDSSSSMDVSLRGSKVRAEIQLSLALQSRHGSRIDLSAFYKSLGVGKKSRQALGCREKIAAHLGILQSMSLFVYESIRFDEIGDEWEQLNFLIYKKFYIERLKVLRFVQKYPMRNPFCIYNAEISSREIIHFMKTQEGVLLLDQLKTETEQTKQRLARIYLKFDKDKVGEKINLYEYDNFSHWIIEELWAELILTQHNVSHSGEQTEVRLCRILQLIFLISELNGKYECSFEQAEIAIEDGHRTQYLNEGKLLFEKYILYKNDQEDEY